MDSTTQIGFARRSRDRPFTLYYKSTTSDNWTQKGLQENLWLPLLGF
jgi:hypothetical protein